MIQRDRLFQTVRQETWTPIQNILLTPTCLWRSGKEAGIGWLPTVGQALCQVLSTQPLFYHHHFCLIFFSPCFSFITFQKLRYHHIQEYAQILSAVQCGFHNCLHPCNHHPNQDTEDFHHLRESPSAPFWSVLSSQLHNHFLNSIHRFCHFYFYVNGSVQCVFFCVQFLSVSKLCEIQSSHCLYQWFIPFYQQVVFTL